MSDIKYPDYAKVTYSSGVVHIEYDSVFIIDDSYETHYYVRDNKKYYYHRIDGPAVIFKKTDCKLWFYNGKIIQCLSQEEFERIIKLKAFW